MTVQVSLCQTWSKPKLLVFSCTGSNILIPVIKSQSSGFLAKCQHKHSDTFTEEGLNFLDLPVGSKCFVLSLKKKDAAAVQLHVHVYLLIPSRSISDHHLRYVHL